jgi:N-acetylglucosamine kinase-like BadF-type ATPase
VWVHCGRGLGRVRGRRVRAACRFLAERFAAVVPSGRIGICNDAVLVVPAAGLADGLGVVAGTGAVGVGLAGGTVVQVGGWGYLLGDEGSGYWTVREAVRRVLRPADAGLAGGPLRSALLAATGAADVPELLDVLYREPAPPSAAPGSPTTSATACW